jgi:Hemerythrin HHE cation binding domain
MSGYPLYAPVHKGLRLALGNLSNHISKMNVEDQAKIDAFVKEFECVAGILHSHAENEDAEIEHFVKKLSPALADRLAIEHHETEELLKELEGVVRELTSSAPEQRKEISFQLYQTFNRFHAAYLNHLQSEEVDIQKLLWANFSEGELHAITEAIISRVSPPHLMEYFRYMIPAQSLEEQVQILGVMKLSAPLPAYQATCSLAQEVLSAEEWNDLKTELDAVV